MKSKGVRAGFLKGGNSSCRRHIRLHYKEYSEACLKAGIPENSTCVPLHILKARQAEEEQASHSNPTALSQTTLGFPVVQGPSSFTREHLLEQLTIHIVCDDQVSTNQASISAY